MQSHFYRLCSLTIVALALLSVDACSVFSPQPKLTYKQHYPNHKAKQQIPDEQPGLPAEEYTEYAPDEYVLNLSLARLDLIQDIAHSPLASELAVVDDYDAQTTPAETQLLAVLDYTSKAGPLQPVVAPIAVRAEADFSKIMPLIDRLKPPAYTLSDIRLVKVLVEPQGNTDLSAMPPDRAYNELDRKQKHMLAQAEKLPPLEEVRLELALIHFFIDHHIRDAAYLCADNARHALAAAHNGTDGGQTISALSKELTVLETRLHKTMPFTLR